MPSKSKIKRAEAEDALRKSGGIISVAARKLGCARETLSRWVTANDVRALLDDIREDTKDRAEIVIMEAIQQKDVSTARWYMERMGKDRGYTQKVDSTIANPDGSPLIPTSVTKTIIDPASDGT